MLIADTADSYLSSTHFLQSRQYWPANKGIKSHHFIYIQCYMRSWALSQKENLNLFVFLKWSQNATSISGVVYLMAINLSMMSESIYTLREQN